MGWYKRRKVNYASVWSKLKVVKRGDETEIGKGV